MLWSYAHLYCVLNNHNNHHNHDNHHRGHSGTPWTRSLTPFLGCRRSTVLCRLWWNSWWTCSSFFDALIPVAEQVIDVPKIFIERIPPRTSLREPQLAEQLVEVPTIVSFSSLQRIMEQTVDIPVPQGGGRHADLQGFLRGQSSTGVEQIVDIPGGGLHRPGQSSSSADEPGVGGFSHFSPNKKVRSWLRT